jgi:predicted MFS family arabinose efflux permease
MRFSPSIRALHIPDSFAALRHPNYRLWAFGLLISSLGGWMQGTAQGYLVFELTQSPVYLGYVGFAGGIPILIFTLFGGVIADRVKRRTLLMITNVYMMLLALVMSALVLLKVVQPWHIIVMSFLLGIANAFDAPSRQGFVLELVGREHMTNAIALNATIFHTATMLGPAVGGLVYAAVGPGYCFAINACSFVAMLFSLSRMKLEVQVQPRQGRSALRDMKEGLDYAFSDETIRTLLGNLIVFGIFGFGMISLLPAWVGSVLGGDARMNGLLLSFRGIGSLIGALMIATLTSQIKRGWLLSVGSLVMAVFVLLFAQFRHPIPAYATMIVIGWGLITWGNLSNALIQTAARDDLRGRVMGLFVLILFGGSPIGSLIVGSLAGWWGAPFAVTICGVALLLSSLFTWLRKPFLRTLQ